MAIDHVYFFCRSPDMDGLVSPRELPLDYDTWGAFYLPAKVDGSLAKRYAFPAILNGCKLTFVLRGRPSELFVAKIPKVGIFEFIAERISDRYLGTLFPNRSQICWFALHPADDRKLDTACCEHDFFFVGLTPDEESP
jgi:hypothetical protein